MPTFAPSYLNLSYISPMTTLTTRIIAAGITVLALQAQSCRTTHSSSASAVTSDTVSIATASSLQRLFTDSLHTESAWRCDSITLTIAADSALRIPPIRATLHRPSAKTVHAHTIAMTHTASDTTASTGISSSEIRSEAASEMRTDRPAHLLLVAAILVAAALSLRKLTR